HSWASHRNQKVRYGLYGRIAFVLNNDLQTVFLLKSAFLCVSCFFGLSSSGTITALESSHLVPFLPFFEVIL
ncbi:hypothetical protein, partial [Paraprevotella clara]|uniref:hypothetical protein n=1 Tax=Paraprevotella clara TaxID=454154 RepID=UPI003FEDEC29